MYSARDDVIEIVHCILRVTQAAIADTIERWNWASKSITQRLPAELLIQCFSWLDKDQLARVTQVSRQWRAIAIGEPSLWTEIHMPVTTAARLRSFALLLDRSRCLPLALHIDESGAEGLGKLIAANMWRVRVLACDTDPLGDIQNAPAAPALESLSISPPTWNGGLPPIPLPAWASGLRNLAMPMFFAPDTSIRFLNLTRFKGNMANSGTGSEHSNALSLFAMCPRLVSLHLTGVRPHSLLPVGPIPRTMAELTLQGSDFDSYLAMWHGHPLHSVVLQNSVYSLSWGLPVAALAQLVRSICPSSWTMSMSSAEPVLSISADSLSAELHHPRTRTLHAQWALIDLRNLVALDLDGRSFGGLISATTVMPTLRSLGLHTAYRNDIFWKECMPLWEGTSMTQGRLDVPQLQAFVLRNPQPFKRKALEFCTGQIPEIIERCFSLTQATTRIPRISLTDVTMQDVVDFDLERIASCAVHLYIDDELVQFSSVSL